MNRCPRYRDVLHQALNSQGCPTRSAPPKARTPITNHLQDPQLLATQQSKQQENPSDGAKTVRLDGASSSIRDVIIYTNKALWRPGPATGHWGDDGLFLYGENITSLRKGGRRGGGGGRRGAGKREGAEGGQERGRGREGGRVKPRGETGRKQAHTAVAIHVTSLGSLVQRRHL